MRNADHTVNLKETWLELERASENINQISYALHSNLDEIEAAVNRLNLGIEVVIPVKPKGVFVGYGSERDQWGFVIEDRRSAKSWMMASAPRWAVIKIVEYMPDILAALSNEAEILTHQINARIGWATAVAEALERIVSDFAQEASRPTDGAS